MSVEFDQLEIGSSYDRPFLARLWGYKGWHAIGRGIVTPAGTNIILLFITKEKQEALEQYIDDFDGETLRMEGETNHANDERIISSLNRDQVHLFYRVRHHLPFTYYGEVYLASSAIPNREKPAQFTYKTSRVDAIAVSSMETEMETHGDIGIPDD